MSPTWSACRPRSLVSLGSSSVPDRTGGPKVSFLGDEKRAQTAMSMKGESGPGGQISIVRRWSSRRFPYGYLVTT